LVGCLVGWLIGRLIGCLIGWLVGLSVALVGLMINRGVGGKHRVMPEGRVWVRVLCINVFVSGFYS